MTYDNWKTTEPEPDAYEEEPLHCDTCGEPADTECTCCEAPLCHECADAWLRPRLRGLCAPCYSEEARALAEDPPEPDYDYTPTEFGDINF